METILEENNTPHSLNRSFSFVSFSQIHVDIAGHGNFL